ncbi:MAG: NUDIX hydrolase [Chloroflexota bacterium]|nr:NUDIX hydrolase [Dehalococcoidia bacterium]MDW8254673.1 NUDIX hydrolase [Chloroflexota bacterium]
MIGQRGPWRVLARREVYRNPWLRVYEDSVIRPDGQPGIYGVVEPEDNAAVVALDDEGRVALIAEFVYPLGRELLQIPSGGVHPGEDPLAAAKRELAEETGLAAERWVSLGRFAFSGGLSTQIGYLFLAQGLHRGPARPEGTERLVLRFVPLAEALALADRSEIIDSPSLVGLYRAARVLGREHQRGE